MCLETFNFGFSYIVHMFSYHTHTLFCDGKGSIVDFCEKAIELGFVDLAFTSHAPVPFDNHYALSFERLLEYRNEVRRAQVEYKDRLNVYLGLEADYIPGQTVAFSQWRDLVNPDFILGSVHFVIDPVTGEKWFIDGDPCNFVKGMDEIFHGDAKRAVAAYYAQVRDMIESQHPDIIGHIDKVKMNNRDTYFLPTDQWYLEELENTLLCVKTEGGVVEINARGIYRGKYHECFPNVEGIKRCMELGILMTLASDSHQTSELAMGLDLARNAARLAGLEKVHLFANGNWNPIELEKVFIKGF